MRPKLGIAGATNADDVLHRMRAFERERERAADQADAEYEQFIQWFERKLKKPDCSMRHMPFRKAEAGRNIAR